MSFFKSIRTGFTQGVDKALAGNQALEQLLEDASDRSVSDEELTTRIALYCQRFGVRIESVECNNILRQVVGKRPGFTAS